MANSMVKPLKSLNSMLKYYSTLSVSLSTLIPLVSNWFLTNPLVDYSILNIPLSTLTIHTITTILREKKDLAEKVIYD